MDLSSFLICSDFDGTFADSKGKIPQENIEAIRRFQSLGGMFTFATGRSPEFVRNLGQLDLHPNAPVITVNGSLLYDQVHDKELIKHPVREVPYELIRRLSTLELYNNTRLVYEDLTDEYFWKGDNERLWAAVKRGIMKAVFVYDDADFTDALSHELRQRYGERLNFARSWPFSLEMLDSRSSKGALLNELKARCPKVRTVIGIGDFDNDVSLLQSADIGVAVANAQPVVKDAADVVLDRSNDEAAIARLIGMLEAGALK